MNYTNHYSALISNAKSRPEIKGYKELHHIIPKCIGGNNDPNNLVFLTAREHYIAHILLAKIHGGPLWHAVNLMGRQKKYTNKMYERARIEHSKLLSNQNKRTKSKPKELRSYACTECSLSFSKLEFAHHAIKILPMCSQSCAARYNGKMSGSKRKGKSIKGHTAWNKDKNSSYSAENGKKGAKKLSASVTGRTRLYNKDGSWTWQYPKKEGI